MAEAQTDSRSHTDAATLGGLNSTFVLGEDIAGTRHADMTVVAGPVYDCALTDQERRQVKADHRGTYSSLGSGSG